MRTSCAGTLRDGPAFGPGRRCRRDLAEIESRAKAIAAVKDCSVTELGRAGKDREIGRYVPGPVDPFARLSSCALYVWAFEREAGGWGLGVTDRLLRFVGVSAVFHALAAPLTYIAYQHYVLTGRLAGGKALPLWLWLVPAVYVAAPAVAGSVTGSASADGKRWTRYIAGRSPAPRAGDHLFSAHDLTGWVRLKMKDEN
jgi:hypothetical protein